MNTISFHVHSALIGVLERASMLLLVRVWRRILSSDILPVASSPRSSSMTVRIAASRDGVKLAFKSGVEAVSEKPASWGALVCDVPVSHGRLLGRKWTDASVTLFRKADFPRNSRLEPSPCSLLVTDSKSSNRNTGNYKPVEEYRLA